MTQENRHLYKFERCFNKRNECSIKFFKSAADEQPFYTQWYNKTGGLICGHTASDDDENHCAECHEQYCEDGREWLECPVCKKQFHEQCFYAQVFGIN